MSSFLVSKPFPRPSLTLFVALQTLDILTTLIGLQLGAWEGSTFIGRLMQAGPLAALLFSKLVAVTLVALAMKYRKPRLVVVLNYWCALVVTWNLAVIFLAGVASKI
jgi:hypothetical protein